MDERREREGWRERLKVEFGNLVEDASMFTKHNKARHTHAQTCTYTHT